MANGVDEFKRGSVVSQPAYRVDAPLVTRMRISVVSCYLIGPAAYKDNRCHWSAAVAMTTQRVLLSAR